MTAYTVEQRRSIPANAEMHAGKKAVYVKLASGYVAWGFADDWQEAELRAKRAAKCLEPHSVKVIKATVNSLFMKAVMRRKGWTEQDAAAKVTEWLTNGSKLSMLDYVEPR